MPPLTVERLEERWTPTMIQTTFAFHSPATIPKSSGISISLPLLNLGWTFALSLTPKTRQKKGAVKRSCTDWIPAAFSFQQHNDAGRWKNTSVRAEISLGEDSGDCPPYNGNGMPLGEMHIDSLASTPSLELPLATSCIISSLRRNRVWLTVTISDCPLHNGLFDGRFGPVNEAEVQAQLVRQHGDGVLNRSLTTGKLYDVKFLAFSTRTSSGNTGEPLPTYASLSVLEGRINLSSSVLRDGWTSAIASLGNIGTNRVGEILCPKDYEYELDSDFEDEDEGASPIYDLSGERDQVVPEGQQSESVTQRSSISLSSFELEGVSDRNLVENQFEEIVKDPNESPFDCEQIIWVKFAAHRTYSWHAFLWYCYTGNLEFAQLRSQVGLNGRPLYVTPLEGGPPTCSPKSMYRLADLLGDKDLKARALAAIKERMTAANVLDETFSIFTSRYPDVREVQLGALMEYCRSPMVKMAFLRAMEKYSNMPHAKPALSAFFDNLVA